MFFDQQQFIANNHNKVEFIARLIVALNSAGLQTHQSSGDADTDIVAVALHCASSGSVTVFADDTDILCLLLYHTSEPLSDIFFWSEGEKVKTIDKCINIKSLHGKIGYNMCQQILVLHALGGCDTTSAIFGHGKGTLFMRLGRNDRLRNHVETLQNAAATHTEVRQAGLQLLIALYDGKPTDTLDSLRYVAYSRLVSASLDRLQPEKLPPSEKAGYFHVHYQAVEWKTL